MDRRSQLASAPSACVTIHALGVSGSPAPTRRERLRAQTLAELKAFTLVQIAEGGPGALSLNTIAPSMGMSGPGLYRYFASRDELLASLGADSYDELADALEAAAEAARRRAPAARLRAIATAFREWALAHPHRYRLVFSTTYGSGLVAPEGTIPAAHRNMLTILGTVADLASEPATGDGASRGLARQLERSARSRTADSARPAAALLLGVLAWTRLHGLVSLEIEGAFAAMEMDPALLFDAEVEELVRRAQQAA